MSSVRQVPGKAARRARMTFLAGRRHVGPAEVRAWIRHRKHVVSSVAVITLCRFRVPQPRNFPMIGIKIGFGDLRMAASAGVHDVQSEAGFIGAPDGVGSVAVVANGKLLGGSTHLLGMNAVLELLLDAVMAPAAGGRHVGCIDTRIRICAR